MPWLSRRHMAEMSDPYWEMVEDLVSLFEEGCQATGLDFWRMLNRRNGFDLHEIFEKATKIELQSDISGNEQVQGV
jgi:hypothetical protein